jgi:hypothetical protein
MVVSSELCPMASWMAQAGRTFGAEGVNVLERLAEDVVVEEEDGVERLILSAGRQITVARQAGEEVFKLLLTSQRTGHGVQGGHVTTQPINV